MGQNKKVFSEAVGEMKHFLLGAALVLTLVTVVPVLAESHPPGDGGGGTPIGDRPVGDRPTGDQQRPTGDQQRSTGDQPRDMGTGGNSSQGVQRRSLGRGRGQGQGLEIAPGQTGEHRERPSRGQREEQPALEEEGLGDRATGHEAEPRTRVRGRQQRDTEDLGSEESSSEGRERGVKKEPPRGRKAVSPRPELEINEDALGEALDEVEGGDAAVSLYGELSERGIAPLTEALEGKRLSKKQVKKLAQKATQIISAKIIKQILNEVDEESRPELSRAYRAFLKGTKRAKTSEDLLNAIEDLDEVFAEVVIGTENNGLNGKEFDDAGMADPAF